MATPTSTTPRPLPRDLPARIDAEVTADAWRRYAWLVEDIFFEAHLHREPLDARDAYELATELRAASFHHGMAVEAAITARTTT